MIYARLCVGFPLNYVITASKENYSKLRCPLVPCPSRTWREREKAREWKCEKERTSEREFEIKVVVIEAARTRVCLVCMSVYVLVYMHARHPSVCT